MKKYDYAYMRIKDFGDELVSDFSQQEFLHIVDCYKLCLAWCVFHVDLKKKSDLKDMFDSACAMFTKHSAHPGTPTVEDIKHSLTNFESELINYKKATIDQQYLSDKSNENYNKLLELYLGEACKLGNLNSYAEILTDFKQCMRIIEDEPVVESADNNFFEKFHKYTYESMTKAKSTPKTKPKRLTAEEKLDMECDRYLKFFNTFIYLSFIIEVIVSVILGIVFWVGDDIEVGLPILLGGVGGALILLFFGKLLLHLYKIILCFLNNIRMIRKNTEEILNSIEE